jgi:uncharacterized membrane protein
MTKHIDRKGWIGLVVFVVVVAAVAVSAAVAGILLGLR